MKPGADPARIVVRSVNWLGDAVMTTPALSRLRQRFPRSKISLITRNKLTDLWQEHPAIDEIIGLDGRESVWSVGRRIRAGRFDLALILPNSHRTALEAFLGRVPRRVGAARPWRTLLLTDPVPGADDVGRMRKRTPSEVRRLAMEDAGERTGTPTYESRFHHLYHYLRLTQGLGCDPGPVAPLLRLSTDELERSRNLFNGPVAPKFWIGVNPGAEYGPAKRWPVERFAEAANELHRRLACGLALFGGPGDVEWVNRLRASISAPDSHVINLAGKTTLRELMIALAACRVLVTNDTGPMHLAAALGVPVVAVFGSTSPELTGPGLPGDSRHRLIRVPVSCAPCFLRDCPIDLRCLTRIGAETVAKAVEQALMDNK